LRRGGYGLKSKVYDAFLRFGVEPDYDVSGLILFLVQIGLIYPSEIEYLDNYRE
jgi:hypothetical protein